MRRVNDGSRGCPPAMTLFFFSPQPLLCFFSLFACFSGSLEDGLISSLVGVTGKPASSALFKRRPLNFARLTEDDIVLYDSKTEEGVFRTYLLVGQLWDEGVVPYTIDQGIQNDTVRFETLKYAFKLFDRYTCIKFRPKEEQDIDYVRFHDARSLRCYSFVGRVGGEQDLGFGPGCEVKIGIVLHEMLHALSFLHEHSRPDRDRYVTIQYQNIKIDKEKQFEKFSAQIAATQGFPFDYNSIMHYEQYAFSKNGKPTIITHEKDAQDMIGQREGFSACDLHKINRLYRCRMKDSIPACGELSPDPVSPTPSSSTFTPTTHQPDTSSPKPDSSTSAPTPKECSDEKDFCAMAQRKPFLCNMYPGLFTFKCRKTCNNCDGTKCFDGDPERCPTKKYRDWCNKNYVSKLCPYSCGLCEA